MKGDPRAMLVGREGFAVSPDSLAVVAVVVRLCSAGRDVWGCKNWNRPLPWEFLVAVAG